MADKGLATPDTRTAPPSGPVGLGHAFAAWVRDVLTAVRIMRMPLIIALVAAAILALPDQILEVYRALAEKVVYSQFTEKTPQTWLGRLRFMATDGEILFGAAGLLLMSLGIWRMARSIARRLSDLVPWHSRTAAAIVTWAPRLLGALPLFAVAAALTSSMPAQTFTPQRLDELLTRLQQRMWIDDAYAIHEMVKSAGDCRLLLQYAAWASLGLAIALLVLPSLRTRRAAAEPRSRSRSAIRLIAHILLVAGSVAAFMLYPVRLPQTIGVLATVALCIIGLTFTVEHLNVWAERARVPIIIPLLLAALAFSAFDLNDNHLIRTIGKDAIATEQRDTPTFGAAKDLPNARDEFRKWYMAREDRKEYDDKHKRYPVYVVAAQGGGIYAATHALTFLTGMQDACPRFAQHMFAISSVSGGSIGAAMFAALIGKHARNTTLRCPPVDEYELGPEVSGAATKLNTEATLYLKRGAYGKAAESYQRTVAIVEKERDPADPAVASSLSNLGEADYYLRRYGDAEPLYKRALAIREKELGSDHPSVAATREKLANLYKALGRTEEADALAKSAEASRQKKVSFATRARCLLQKDYLSPLVGATLFPDFLQRFLPVALPKLSRARAFELALEAAWDEDVAAAEKSGDDPCKSLAAGAPDPSNPFRKGFLELWKPNGVTPALLVNTTEASTGRRRVIAPFTFGRTDNANEAEEFKFLPIASDNDVPLSTAASLSARFPWLTPAGYFREDGKNGITKVRLGDGAYFDNSGVATALDLIDELEKDLKDPDTGQPLPVDINLIVLTGAGDYSDQKYYGFGELYSPIQSLLAARQATTWSAIRRAVGQIDRIPHVAAGTEGGPHIARLRQVRIADVFYPLPLGWRLSNLTQEAIRFQAGDGKRCAPDAASFKQTIKDFFATDCLQRVMYHELKGDDLRRAAETLRASAEARAALAATSPLQPGDLADRPGEGGSRAPPAAADRSIVGHYRASVEYAAGKLAPDNKSNMHGRFAIYQDKDGADYRVYFRVPYYNIGEATGTLKGNIFSIDYEDKSFNASATTAAAC